VRKVSKKLVLIMTVVVIMGLLVGCSGKKETVEAGGGSKVSEGPIVLRLGHVTQTSHPFHLGAAKFAELVENKSNGNIKIELYPARQLGDDRELLEQVMNGTLDMGVISSPLFSSYTPLLDSLQLPFLLNTYNKENQAVTSDEMKAIFKSLEGYDLKVFGVFEGGMRQLANNKRQINTPADLEGLKLRAVPSELILTTLKALGANPTPMAYGEVYSALQTNVIDGEEVNITSIYSEKHYEVINYVTVLGLFPFPGINVMNLKIYNKLTDENKKIMQEASDEAVQYVFDQFAGLEKTALDFMKEKGVEINYLDDVSTFTKLTQQIYSEYTSKDELIKKFVDMARNLK